MKTFPSLTDEEGSVAFLSDPLETDLMIFNKSIEALSVMIAEQNAMYGNGVEVIIEVYNVVNLVFGRNLVLIDITVTSVFITGETELHRTVHRQDVLLFHCCIVY